MYSRITNIVCFNFTAAASAIQVHVVSIVSLFIIWSCISDAISSVRVSKAWLVSIVMTLEANFEFAVRISSIAKHRVAIITVFSTIDMTVTSSLSAVGQKIGWQLYTIISALDHARAAASIA